MRELGFLQLPGYRGGEVRHSQTLPRVSLQNCVPGPLLPGANFQPGCLLPGSPTSTRGEGTAQQLWGQAHRRHSANQRVPLLTGLRAEPIAHRSVQTFHCRNEESKAHGAAALEGFAAGSHAALPDCRIPGTGTHSTAAASNLPCGDGYVQARCQGPSVLSQRPEKWKSRSPGLLLFQGNPRRTSPSPPPTGTGPAPLPGHAVSCAKEPQPIPEAITPPLNGHREPMAQDRRELTSASSLGVTAAQAQARLHHLLSPTCELSEDRRSPRSQHGRRS